MSEKFFICAHLQELIDLFKEHDLKFDMSIRANVPIELKFVCQKCVSAVSTTLEAKLSVVEEAKSDAERPS